MKHKMVLCLQEAVQEEVVGEVEAAAQDRVNRRLRKPPQRPSLVRNNE